MLNLPSTLEEIRALKNAQEFLSCTRAFHKEKVYMELSIRQKSDFLINKAWI